MLLTASGLTERKEHVNKVYHFEYVMPSIILGVSERSGVLGAIASSVTPSCH